jgi:hypothetical protein
VILTANVYWQHGAKWAVELFAPVLQKAPERARGDREHHVVDGPAERALALL